MKQTRITICFVVIAAMLAIWSIPCKADENLGNILSDSGWNRILGTWVDAETKGAKSMTTYAWKFKNRVIAAMGIEGEKETLSLIGQNPKTGEVFNISVDSEGGSSLGKWTLKKEEAILELVFVTGAGVEGALRIRFKLEDDNTLIVTVDLPEPLGFKMIRIEPKTPYKQDTEGEK